MQHVHKYIEFSFIEVTNTSNQFLV